MALAVFRQRSDEITRRLPRMAEGIGLWRTDVSAYGGFDPLFHGDASSISFYFFS
jgi:hypothetical protein